MSASELFSIGALSRKTGCKVPTIRYYEQVGLLPEPYRTEGQQRRYKPDHLRRLRFILHSRELGFSLDDIRELLRLAEDSESDQHNADLIASKHLDEVERKIAQLKALQKELKAMVNDCGDKKARTCSKTASSSNKTKRYRKCRVIEVLSDHRLCRAEHLSS